MKFEWDERTKPRGTVASMVHKQILEIKKKIQLSEGQRKAIFEECESENRRNIEKIQKLKEEIQELLDNLKQFKLPTYGKRLETIIGVYENKTFDEIQEVLRLQVIDKVKLLDLLNFKQKRNKKLLASLAEEYRQLLFSQTTNDNIDAPLKTKISDLQNNIHAIEIQFNEGNQINQRYNEIRHSLLDDSTRFESNLETVMKRIDKQHLQLNKLFQIVEEATKMRATVRNCLLHEEKRALINANKRDKQTSEGQRLVNSGREQLEFMEKFVFQTQKMTMKTTNPEDNSDVVDIDNDEIISETKQQEDDELFQIFEELKIASGATSIEEIHQKFVMQHDTNLRLLQLRMKLELNKKQLEKQIDLLTNQLDQFKYGDSNYNSDNLTIRLETIQIQLKEQRKRYENCKIRIQNRQESLNKIYMIVSDLYSFIDPYGRICDGTTKLSTILQAIKANLSVAIQTTDFFKFDEKLRQHNENLTINDEFGLLPTPYNSLMRKTPLPQQQQNASPIPPPTRQGSEDDDEVPSRTYLKRQAQLVIDAKSRKKKHN